MPTASALITQALKLIGVADSGETPSASVMNDSFTALNQMLDSWQIERLNVVTILPATFNLTTATQSYEIGPDGTGAFQTARPLKIEQAHFISTVNGVLNRFPLKLLSQPEWAEIARKLNTSNVPDALYNDRAYPDSTLYLYPIPQWSSGTCSLELYLWYPLPQFASLADNENLAPGYLRAVTYNLAIEIAAIYGIQVPQPVVMIAEQAKDAIRAFNDPNPGDPPVEMKSNAVAPPQQQGPQR